MRLIHVRTFQLEWFSDAQSAPPYAILSHTWEADEVVFADITSGETGGAWRKKATARKIHSGAAQADKDGLAYIWIDNCCIDKSSSAELSEAINSMFKWYAYARVCYAYLADAGAQHQNPIQGCRWFTRGFTLQELIAPSEVQFFDGNWQHIGSRTELGQELSRITSIDTTLLSRRPVPRHDPELAFDAVNLLLGRINIATRMSWAAGRSTTRVEDVAYCLLGIFNVNMPLLYGEGGMKAFHRLQEEIMNRSDDPSILAFQGSPSREPSLLARHPREFVSPLPAVRHGLSRLPTLSLGKSRVTVNLLLCPAAKVQQNTMMTAPTMLEPTAAASYPEGDLYYAMFDCTFASGWLARPAILLRQVAGVVENEGVHFVRQDPHLYSVSRGQSFQASVRRRYPDPVVNRDNHTSELEYNSVTNNNRPDGVPIWCESATRKTLTILDGQYSFLTLRQQTQQLADEVPHVEIFIQNGSGLLGTSNYKVGRSTRTFYEEEEEGTTSTACHERATPPPRLIGCIPRGVVEFVEGREEEEKDHRFFVTWGFQVITTSQRTTAPTSLKPWCRLWTSDGLKSALGQEFHYGDDDNFNRLFETWHEARVRLIVPPGDAGESGNADKLFTGDKQRTMFTATMTIHRFLERPFFELNVAVESNISRGGAKSNKPEIYLPSHPVLPNRTLAPTFTTRRAMENRGGDTEEQPGSSGRKRSLFWKLASGHHSGGAAHGSWGGGDGGGDGGGGGGFGGGGGSSGFGGGGGC